VRQPHLNAQTFVRVSYFQLFFRAKRDLFRERDTYLFRFHQHKLFFQAGFFLFVREILLALFRIFRNR
jgi:hypothetical protein